MRSYRAPVRDTLFLLYDVLGMEGYGNLPGFAEADRAIVEAILAEGGRLAEEVLAPLNRGGDQQGCVRHGDGRVTTPQGFAEAYRTFAAGGWIGLSSDPAYGGQGLPFTLTAAINEYVAAANMAFGMYPGLTQGAIAALDLHGSPEQKAIYLPRLIRGDWSGTMNLTEPHCGTDLGLIRTKAVPAGDGSYRISGTKIFISAGEHDLTSNIIHLVLARLEGAPPGTQGLSLFVVPKLLPTDGGRNAVSCGAIEEKMGIHGNATCVMNYDGATGWLVGEANAGLKAMFTMMNEARIGVGVQGLAISEAAYQRAAAYARERLQGRALSTGGAGEASAERPADPIIVHPDVRRMLLTARAFNEGARALLYWTTLKADIARRTADSAQRQAANDTVSLMTPVIKGVFTDRGFDNAVAAQQVFGGHGYIAEHGMEQLVRDARIAMLYEGTNGIQALDLVGRKLGAHGGRAVTAFLQEVGAFCRDNAGNPALLPFIGRLKAGLDDLARATLWLMQNAPKRAEDAAAGATDYMHLFGLVALGYMWGRIAAAAEAGLRAGADGNAAFLEAKLATGCFFMERMMPETASRLARIEAGAGSIMALPAEMF